MLVRRVTCEKRAGVWRVVVYSTKLYKGGGREGATPREVQPLTLLYTSFDRKAGLDKNLNSSLSFGQAALIFHLPSTTFHLSQLKFSLPARMNCLGPYSLGR